MKKDLPHNYTPEFYLYDCLKEKFLFHGLKKPILLTFERVYQTGN